MFWAIDYLCLALVLAAGVAVIRVKNLNAAVMALSAIGTVLTVLFVVLGAPDDAHSEIVVGAIALPTLYLIAIGKARVAVQSSQEASLGEEAGQDSGRRGARAGERSRDRG